MAEQIKRSGTSIGANVSESQYKSINNDAEELVKLLKSIVKTSKARVRP